MADTVRTLDDLKDRAAIRVYPDLANVLGCSKKIAYEAVREGKVPSFRVRSRIFIPVPKLLALLGADAA
jgi:hypothetical protein